MLTLEIRLLKGGGAVLRRVDEYHGNFPATLLTWKEFALGDPVIGIVPRARTQRCGGAPFAFTGKTRICGGTVLKRCCGSAAVAASAGRKQFYPVIG